MVKSSDPIPKKRKFGTKTFSLCGVNNTRNQAENFKEAMKVANPNIKIRIVPVLGRFPVYIRHEAPKQKREKLAWGNDEWALPKNKNFKFKTQLFEG